MKKVLLNLVILICLAVFVVCAYQLVQYFYGNMESEMKFDKQRDMVSDTMEFDKRIPKYEQMKGENQDFVGWIIADGTNVNYPMVQTPENQDYYLDRNFQKDEDLSGTIFVSRVANLDEPTDVVTIFGHNMKDGTMFGSLRRYEDSQFLEEHDRIWIDSLKERRAFEVTHVMRIRVDVNGQKDVFPYYQYSNFENEEEYNLFIEQCNAHSIYSTGKTTEFGDKFVILSTCEYTYGDGSGRLVIMGKELKDENGQVTSGMTPEITKPMMGTYVLLGIIAASALIIAILITSIISSLRRKKKRKQSQ